MRAIGILRESSEKQVQEDRQGLDDQRREISDFAAKSGLEIIDWKTVVESASRWDRPQWEAKIDEVIEQHDRGEIDAIIFHRFDRETRNPFASVPIIDRALRSGVEVYFAADEFTLDPRDPDAVYRYVEELSQGVAYARAVSKGWRRVHHRRARRNKHPTNQKLFGFRYDDGDRVLDEAAVPFAREAVDMFLKNKLLSPVVRWLQSHCPGLNSPSALRRWLQNPALKGETYACGEVINHPALLSPEEWEEIQGVLKQNRGRRVPRKGYLPIPFFCKCGGRMVAERHDTRVYIRCRRCSGQPFLRLDRLQAMISLATVIYVQEKHYFDNVEIKANIRARVITDLDENRRAKNRLSAQWEAFLLQKMGDWRGPKEILAKKEKELISQEAALNEKENRLLHQLGQLPEVEVIDIQQAWEEALLPYEVHFLRSMSPIAQDEEDRRMVVDGYRPGPLPGAGVEIPAWVSVQGYDGIPNGWGSHGWNPSKEFRRIFPPMENWIWAFLKDLRAEAFLSQGRIKLRFQLRVTARRSNRTPSYTFPC